MSWINGSLNSSYGKQVMSLIPLASVTMTAITLSLDSNYVYATSGDAVYTFFVPVESGDLTDFWIYVSSYTGTWGLTDGKIKVEIRLGQSANGTPGNTLVGSFDIILNGSTTGWIRTTGISINLTATQVYSIVIGDPDGSASNYVTITQHVLGTSGVPVFSNGLHAQLCSTSNGFSTAGSTSANALCCVLQQAGLIYSGSVFGSANTLPSSRYERGIKFKPVENCTVVGCVGQNDVYLTSNLILKIYEDGRNPKETALMSYSFPSFAVTGTSLAPVAFIIPEAYHTTLKKDNWYRFVLYPGTNLTIPRKITLLGTPDSYVLQSLPFYGNCYHTLENASGIWDDDTFSTSFFSPILVPNTDNTEKVSFTVS